MGYPIPDEALAAHTAVLGKTGAGKTSTAKSMVEHLVGEGARVCVLDPIKSDWWGLTSSADGKRPGLPFRILGGPRGHVPLHAPSGAALAEIVASEPRMRPSSAASRKASGGATASASRSCSPAPGARWTGSG